MSAVEESIRSELVALVGEPRVIFDPEACAALSVDGRIPKYVVYAPAPEQVAALLRCAAERDLAVIPCRNGTKLATGNPPRRYDVALSLKELTRVWHYEPADLTVTVEPGMKFGDLQHFLRRHGLWLPLDPRGGAKASLGGILATNSSGSLRLRYGTPRDMVLGLKVATAEGKVIKTGGRVVKNVAGYDLGKLLIGSYGTLGVIVEASLKLFPLAAEVATFVLPAGTLGIARDLRRSILRSPLDPLRLVLLDAGAAARLRTPASRKEPELWVQMGGSERVLERCARELEELGRGAGAPLERVNAAAAELLWTRIADFAAWLGEGCPDLVVLKAALPLAASEEFLSRAQQEAASENVALASFAQVGVGIVHLCLLEGGRVPARAGLVTGARRAAEDLGGSLVVERCPLELKSRVEVWGGTGDDYEAMRKLKAVWDPKGILSPGRFVGGL